MKKKAILILCITAVVTVLVWRWHGQKKTGEAGTESTAEAQTEDTETTENLTDQENDTEGADVIDSEFIDPETGHIDLDKYYESLDIDAWYRKMGEVVAVYGVKDSERTQTEKEAEEFLTERGFTQYPVTFDYTMDAEFLNDQEVTGSDEKHPMYQTYYMSEAGEFWSICLSNGYLVANPVSYNMVSDLDVQTVVTESEIFPGYNDKDNTFYEIIPDESSYIMKIVDRIDADTLDMLTTDALAEL